MSKSLTRLATHMSDMEAQKRSLELEIANKTITLSHLKQKKPRVRFDEEIIAEHDKDRGTRMKIDEPKTPFVREGDGHTRFFFPGQDRGEHGASAVPERVEEEEEEIEALPPIDVGANTMTFMEIHKGGRPPMLDMNLLTSSLEAVKEKDDFAKARSSHYDEAKKLKEWKEKLANEMDEDDEEE